MKSKVTLAKNSNLITSQNSSKWRIQSNIAWKHRKCQLTVVWMTNNRKLCEIGSTGNERHNCFDLARDNIVISLLHRKDQNITKLLFIDTEFVLVLLIHKVLVSFQCFSTKYLRKFISVYLLLNIWLKFWKNAEKEGRWIVIRQWFWTRRCKYFIENSFHIYFLKFPYFASANIINCKFIYICFCVCSAHQWKKRRKKVMAAPHSSWLTIVV